MDSSLPDGLTDSLRDTLLQHSAHAILATQDIHGGTNEATEPKTLDDVCDADAVPSLQKLLSLRKQQQQQQQQLKDQGSVQSRQDTSSESKKDPEALSSSADATQPPVAKRRRTDGPDEKNSSTILPVYGAPAGSVTTEPSGSTDTTKNDPNTVKSIKPDSNGAPQELQGLVMAPSSPTPAVGNGQVAMMYSPSLEGNVPVRALPIAQLSVSTQKIFKFRTFSVFLELNSAYVRKQHLTSDDIMKAGISAKCCKEETPGVDIFSCPVCSSKKRIIELSVSNAQSFGPRKTAYGTEIYVFNSCKTNCSSSRDHHKSNICIVIDSLPGAGMIISPPLVLQAREKQQSLSKSKGFGLARDGKSIPTSPIPGVVVNGPRLVQQGPQPPATGLISFDGRVSNASFDIMHQQQLPSVVLSPATQPAGTSTPVVSTPVVSQQQQQQQQLAPSTTTTPASPASPANVQSWAPVFSAAVAQNPALDVKVKVTLMSSLLPAADIERSVQHFKTYLQQLPGFIQFKYSILPGFFVGFTFFDTEEHHNAASTLLKNYLQNINGVTNIFGENLVSSGSVVVLASCTSW